MLPMIGVPTTAGTGSEAQSYAIISDPRTHKKMACGDPKAAFRAVILDPRLTVTQPASVTAAAGYDALVARGRKLRVHEADAAIPGEVAGGMAAARARTSSACWRRQPISMRARAMQLGAFHAGSGDRAVDARRHARVREPVDGALRHDARPRRSRFCCRTSSDGTRAWQNRCTQSCRVSRPPRLMRSPTRLSVLGRTAASAADTARGTACVEGRLPSARQMSAAEQWTGRFNPRPFDASGRPGDLRMRVLIAFLLSAPCQQSRSTGVRTTERRGRNSARTRSSPAWRHRRSRRR